MSMESSWEVCLLSHPSASIIAGGRSLIGDISNHFRGNNITTREKSVMVLLMHVHVSTYLRRQIRV